MSGWARKRFWKDAAAAETEAGWEVRLDGRPLRTPAKAVLVLPTRALAERVAAEWAAQGETIRPQTMPATRTANTALDRVRPQQAAVAEAVAAYGGSDLLCYRADHPAELAARQAAGWDPLLAWAAGRYGVEWRVVTGLMPAEQPQATLARLSGAVQALDPFRLAAFHDLVALSGSLVIGLAAAEGQAAPEDLWALSRLDEDWQAELWGQDAEAAATAAQRRAAFLDAAAFLRDCA